MNKFENNQVMIYGEIAEEFKYSHNVFGENFYITHVHALRMSGEHDEIPVVVSDRLVDVSRSVSGQYVTVCGQFRSFNKQDSEGNKLVLSVFAQDFDMTRDDELKNVNNIYLDGYICKNPVYRVTPLGREIADVLLAVNRQYGKSDYIPCVFWGRNARYAGSLPVGTRIKVFGRVQSRNYNKRMGGGVFEKRTAYEVSASRLEVCDEN